MNKTKEIIEWLFCMFLIFLAEMIIYIGMFFKFLAIKCHQSSGKTIKLADQIAYKYINKP